MSDESKHDDYPELSSLANGILTLFDSIRGEASRSWDAASDALDKLVKAYRVADVLHGKLSRVLRAVELALEQDDDAVGMSMLQGIMNGKDADIADEKSQWSEVGSCDVDAGMIFIGDPCYITPRKSCKSLAAKPFRDYNDLLGVIEAASGFPDEHADLNHMPDAIQLNHDLGHNGLGVIVSGFGGDGTFPVSVKRNRSGMVVAAKISFQPDPDEAGGE